jgi:DNA-binding CsgD family transcriptional regulator
MPVRGDSRRRAPKRSSGPWDHVAMGTDRAGDFVSRGREALAGADWGAARACFEQARALGESAEVLDGLAQAAHFQGSHAEAIELRERAFAAYRRRGEQVAAAEQARWLGFLYAAVHGNRAAAGGWMSWAERLLEGADECLEHGRLKLDSAAWTDDPAERERLALEAMAIARRFGSRDLEFAAQALLGHAYVVSGRAAEGMSLIDQAMAAVAGGEVVAVDSIGEIYCRLLGACERAIDVRRAEEWITAAARFVAWGDFVSPTCRIHYGGILIAIGRWEEAERELLAAARIFEGGYRGMRAAPLIRLARLRVLQGRFEAAERLLDGHESRPGAREVLAEIALAQGNLALAQDRARLCLGGGEGSSPDCAPLLGLLVQIHLARADLDAAREVHERLLALAPAGPRARAAAELAAGRLGAAEGDEQAPVRLQAALHAFSALNLPLEAGQAQLELARALAPSARAGAAAEARVALATFERLGAVRDADAAAELLRTLGESHGRAWPKRAGMLTKRETEVLSLVAEGCSNPQIAERLFISRRTAEHHVSSILTKLDLSSRAEAAVYAVRGGPEKPVGE